MESSLEALPGVCEGSESSLMLSVKNTGVEAVTVDRWLPLAFGPGSIDEGKLN